MCCFDFIDFCFFIKVMDYRFDNWCSFRDFNNSIFCFIGIKFFDKFFKKFYLIFFFYVCWFVFFNLFIFINE